MLRKLYLFIINYLKRFTQKQITEALRHINQIHDNLGLPVDENIKLLLAALRLLDFTTTSSCGGHVDHRTPYVDISSYAAEEFEKSTKVLNLINLIIQYPNNIKYQDQYNKICSLPRKSNLQEASRLMELLGDFYKNRNVPIDIRLIIDSLGDGLGGYRLHSQGSFTIHLKNKRERANWMELSQTEMNDFAEFLCNVVK